MLCSANRVPFRRSSRLPAGTRRSSSRAATSGAFELALRDTPQVSWQAASMARVALAKQVDGGLIGERFSCKRIPDVWDDETARCGSRGYPDDAPSATPFDR